MQYIGCSHADGCTKRIQVVASRGDDLAEGAITQTGKHLKRTQRDRLEFETWWVANVRSDVQVPKLLRFIGTRHLQLQQQP